MIVESISGAVQLLQGILTKTDSQGHTSLLKLGASLNPGDSLVLLSGATQIKLLNGLVVALTPNQPFSLDSISPFIKQSPSPTMDEMVEKALAKGLDISKFIETLQATEAGVEVLGSGGTAFIVDPYYGFGLVTAGYQTRGPFSIGSDAIEYTVFLYGNTKPEAVLTLNDNSLVSDESITVRNGDRNAADQVGVVDPFNYGPVIGFAEGYLVSSAGSSMNQPAHFVKASYSLEIGKSASGLYASNGSPITLSLVDNKIVAKSEGKVIFAIGIDEQTGKITVVQYHGIYHPDPNSADESISLVNLVKVTLTLTDKSGDVSKATIDVGGKIHFEDDAPFINHIDSLLLDDNSNLNQGGTIVSGTIDVDFGSDLAKNLIFSETAIAALAQINLTSNGQALSYTIDAAGHVLTATVSGTDRVIFTLTLSAVTPNAIQQEMPKYHLHIVEAIDQPTSSDAIHLAIPIKAIDADNDSALGNIVITIDDGNDALGGFTTGFTLTEGDLDPRLSTDIPYPVSEEHTFSIPAGADRLLPESLIIENSFLSQLIDELEQEVTAGGSSLTVTQANINGEITLTALNDQNEVVFTLTITAINDISNDKDLLVTVTLIQEKPLDHQENGNKVGFVSQDGESIHIALQLQAKDSDGDPLQSPVTVEITINDNSAPELGSHQIEFTENLTVQTQTGQVPLDLGSDAIETLVFKNTPEMQESLNGLTSGGWQTSYSFQENGTVLVLRIDDLNSSANGQELLKVTIGTDGSYTAVLSGPLDHINTDDLSKLILDVRATDKDGDSSNLGRIEITIKDAIEQNYDVNAEVSITEGSLSQGTYPVSDGVAFTLQNSADRLLPETVIFDPLTIGDLIAELESEIKVNGVSLSFNVNGNIITGSLNGTEVLTIQLTAEQNANHYDVDARIQVTLHGPIDHNQNDNTDPGLVHLNGDEIIINIGVQIKDSDGDSLAQPAKVEVKINDGPIPAINPIEPILVKESDIDGNPNHPGSNATADGETASGTITVQSGSDTVVSYRIDVDAFNSNAHNYGTWTSGGNAISLSYNSMENIYIGSADGVVKFTLVLNNNGDYTFTLLGSIDHLNEQGKNTLDVIFPVIATDADGDDSDVAQLPISIEDDVPSASDVTFAFTEGATVSLGDITSVSQEGADTGRISFISTYNADGTQVTVPVIGILTQVNSIIIRDASGQELGTLHIRPNGVASFESNPNISHDALVLTQNIPYTVVDADGDTATANIILNISDRAATLTLTNALGDEDVGRDADEVLIEPPAGIPINMSINIGDYDNGEVLGQVTIRIATANVHGKFYYDGVEIVPTVQGANSIYTIPIGAFSVSIDNTTYTLNQLSYVPDVDYATYDAGLNFLVSAVVFMQGDPLQAKAPVTGTFNVNVKAIADVPIWDLAQTTVHYDALEDSTNVNLQILGERQDIDDSEIIDHYLLKITEGEGNATFVGIGTITPDGYFKVSAANIGSVQVNPADDFSGIIKVEAIVVSKEQFNVKSSDANGQYEFAQSAPIELTIDVKPVADPAKLTITTPYLVSNEDTLINMNSLINLSKAADNIDLSENTFIRISGVPDGAIFILYGESLDVSGLAPGLHDLSITYTDTLGQEQTVHYQYNNDGSNSYYQISTVDLEALFLQPIPESNVDFALTVQGVVIDTATLSTGSQTDIAITEAQLIEVNMKGVADDPDFGVTGTDWSLIVDDNDEVKGVETTIPEDGEARLDFEIFSGEKLLAPADTSETLTLVISGLPVGAQLRDDDGNTLTLTYVGKDSSGQPKYEVNLTSLNDLIVIPPPNSTKDITLNARLIVTENDGDSLTVDKQIVIHITPVIDAVDYARTSYGFEDQLVTVDWQPPQFSDSQEEITGIRLEGIPAGSILLINSIAITALGDTDVELTDVQVQQLLSGATLQFQGPENSDVDVNLNVIVTVTQNDVDSSATASENITGSVHLDIRAVVEPDAELQVLDPAQQPVTSIAAVNGIVDLSAATGQNHVTFQDLDESSDEIIKTLVINFPEGLAHQFIVVGGVYNGVNGWIIPESELDNLQIISRFDYNGSVVITIHAQVQDMGDNGENDVSELVRKDTGEITLVFDGTGGGGGGDPEEAGTITIADDVITGVEDVPVTFGDQLESMLTLTDGTDNDVYALIIDGPLPEGFTLSGSGVMYDFVNDRYIIQVTPDGNGGLSVGDVILETPEDYSGSLPFNISWVATNMASGDVNQGDASVVIPVDIAPIADEPSLTLQVVQTEGLDPDMQPGGSETIPNLAYEDGLITLNLGVLSTDNDSSEQITSVQLKVDPAQGHFVDSNGNPLVVVDGFVTIPVGDLNNIKFQPVADFSGEVSVTVKVTVLDTAQDHLGNSVEHEQTFEPEPLTFNVLPVNDPVTFDGNDPFNGDEDTGGVAFTGMTVSANDSDGSEVIVSLVIHNVPDGFLIGSAQNMGNGDWSITVNSSTYDLSQIKLIPPDNFSGSVDLTVTAYTKENLAALPEEAGTHQFTVNVAPVSDVVDTVGAGPDSSVTGIENENLTINLNIQARDNTNSYTGSGSNVSENDPETLLLTIHGVPEGAELSLPPGVDGTVTKMPDNTWVVTVNSSQLASLIYNPGDSNGVTPLTIEAQAVDNGEAPGPVKTINVTLDVEAVNDAPENTVPDELIADEDAPLLITGLQVTDIDAGSGNITVTLTVQHGILTLVGDSTGIGVTGDDSNMLQLTGTLDAINALLLSGVNYQGDGNFHGTDTLTMTTNDNGNTGTGGPLEAIDAVDIIVNPKADTPELTVVYQTMIAALGALIPLHLSADVVSPIDGELTVRLDGLGNAVPVDSSGNEIGFDSGNGSWVLNPDQLSNLYLRDMDQGTHNITVTAVSDVGDGQPEASVPQTINLTVIDSAQNELQGTDGNDYIVGSDFNDVLIGVFGDDILDGQGGDDLLIGGDGNDTLFGGDGNDVLIGGAGNDTLTGGNGEDVFKWEVNDHGAPGQPDMDVITDFNQQEDKIDLSELLQGENTSNYSNYLHFEYDSATETTVLSISTEGNFDENAPDPNAVIAANTDQVIFIHGVDFVNGSNTQTEIINNLVALQQVILDA